MTKKKFNFSRKIKPGDKKKDFSGYLHTILVLIALVKLSVGTFTYIGMARLNGFFWGEI